MFACRAKGSENKAQKVKSLAISPLMSFISALILDMATYTTSSSSGYAASTFPLNLIYTFLILLKFDG